MRSGFVVKHLEGFVIQSTPIRRTNRKTRAGKDETICDQSTNTANTLRNTLPIINRSGLPETFFPRFNRTTTQSSSEINKAIIPSLSPPDDEQIELVIQATSEETQQIILPEEQRRLKAERQRKKNEKYKWKKRNLPHFHHKIRRPIFAEYDQQGIWRSHDWIQIGGRITTGEIHYQDQLLLQRSIQRKIGEEQNQQ